MSDSESDWFDKDEDEILKNFQTKAKKVTNTMVEHIDGRSATEEYLQQKRIEAATKQQSQSSNAKRLTTSTLRKAVNMEPMDLFLFVICESDFFVEQISINDELDRGDIVAKLSKNTMFLEKMRILTAKIFQNTFKPICENMEKIDQILAAVKTLLIRFIKAQLNTPQISDLCMHIKQIITDSDNQDILCRNSCRQLSVVLDQELKPAEVSLGETIEIYPSLDELLSDAGDLCKNEKFSQITKPDAVTNYIASQKQKLREYFIIPIKEYICKLRNCDSFEKFNCTPELWNEVFIVVNTNFINAKRHEMTFIDMLGNKRKKDNREVNLQNLIKEKIAAIKTGSLLILSTSKDFDNLILVTVTYTDGQILSSGYIGIEIIRQYNIGMVYDRPLIMFESPVFFEPYNNVYHYLNTYGDDELPMKSYIIENEKNVRPPRYLKPEVPYTYDGKSFNVSSTTPCKPSNLPLNQPQWNAYLEALTKEFCLIQGPPGTGKTHLSVQLARTLMENAQKPIVVIAYTNDSLDKFLLRLSAYTQNIVRFGSQTHLPEISRFSAQNSEYVHKEMINPKLKQLYYITNEEFKTKFEIVQKMYADFDGSEDSYQRLIQAQKDLRAVKEKLASVRIMFQYYLARKANFIAMTSTFAAKTNFLFRLLQSRIVIFEEAAEISESHVLACLTPYTEHVIMIGDHMQLKPPTSSNHQSHKNCHLNVSLFERLFVDNLKGPTLYIQYRMRPCISGLLYPTFYTKLTNDESVENYPKDSNTIHNEFEANNILKLAKHLIEKAAYTVEDIVILTPYAKQKELLSTRAKVDTAFSHLNISTVDSFQGLEANIVLLSLVRSNSKNQIGFLEEKNRICVALSRAKYGMYIIGNMQLLAKCSETWEKIKEKLEENAAIGNMFPISPNEG